MLHVASRVLGLRRPLSAGPRVAAHPCRVLRSKRATLQVVATSRFEAENPYAQELRDTAKYISQVGRGILASDESNMTTGTRPHSALAAASALARHPALLRRHAPVPRS